LLLLLVAAQIDRARRKPGVDAVEGGVGRIDARHLHADEAVQQHGPAGGAIAPITDPGDVELAQLRHGLERKLRPRPAILDDRRDLALHEIAHASDDRALLRVEDVNDLVEVTVHGRRSVSALPCRCRHSARHGILPALLSLWQSDWHLAAAAVSCRGCRVSFAGPIRQGVTRPGAVFARCQAKSRSSRRKILPTVDLGSASRNFTVLGTL